MGVKIGRPGKTLDIGDLDGALFMDYFHALDEAVRGGVDVGGAAFIAAIEDTELSRLASEIALCELPPGPHDRFLADTLVWLRREALKEELETMKERLRALEASKPESNDEMRAVEKMYEELSRRLRTLRTEGGDSN